MMTFAEFHNGLRLLNSIDASEIGNPDWWPEFRDDPFRFLMRCPDLYAGVIWRAMEKRGAVKGVPSAEQIAWVLCCGKAEHCNAAEHASDHDMSNDRYAEFLGCEGNEIRKQATAVEVLLRGVVA